jgi:hypothetical protein
MRPDMDICENFTRLTALADSRAPYSTQFSYLAEATGKRHAPTTPAPAMNDRFCLILERSL